MNHNRPPAHKPTSISSIKIQDTNTNTSSLRWLHVIVDDDAATHQHKHTRSRPTTGNSSTRRPINSAMLTSALNTYVLSRPSLLLSSLSPWNINSSLPGLGTVHVDVTSATVLGFGFASWWNRRPANSCRTPCSSSRSVAVAGAAVDGRGDAPPPPTLPPSPPPPVPVE